MLKRLFVPILMLCLLLAGCRDHTEESNQDQKEADIAMTSLAMTTPYTIIRPDVSDEIITDLSVNLKNVLSVLCGDIRLSTDWSKDGSYDPASPEILIGETNRSESAVPKTRADKAGIKHWYYIGIDGTKVVLTGSDDFGTIAAIQRYIKEFAEQSNSNSLAVPTSLLVAYDPDEIKLVENAIGIFAATDHLGQAPYFADGSGLYDMTDIIQAAIDHTAAAGGGTVYLPRGIYRISNGLNIPSYVTLRGDAVDPDSKDMASGTVLLLAKKGNFKASSAVSLNHSAAVQGITFYYEKQSLESPIEYAATIDLLSQTATTVKDCNFINSWTAIYNGERPNGMVTLENLKGTALYCAIYSDQRADISITQNIHFSPKYWAQGSEAFGEAPSEEAIRAFMKTNESVGIHLGDVDRDTYENITLDGYATAIYNRPMTRAGLSGSWYNLTIKDSQTALRLEGVDTRYGFLIADASIEGDVINATDLSKLTNPAAFSYIYMLNAEIDGAVEGRVQNLITESSDEIAYTPKSAKILTPAAALFDSADYNLDATGKSDISARLQKALDDCAAAGGGIVYLRAGHYLLENPVTIASGVQLLGAQQNPQGTNNTFAGTILYVTYGKTGDIAAITVNGDNAGISGLVVYYKENGISADTYMADPNEYSFFLRLTGKNNFACNLGMAAISHAIHFDGASDFICDRILMTAYHEGIRVTNCQGGLVTRIHTNGTYHTMGQNAAIYLSDDWCWNGAEVVEKILDAHIIHNFTLFTVEDSVDLQYTHVFHYGAYRYMTAENSDIFILNGESSRLTGLSFMLTDSTLRVINFMRPNPSAYIDANGKCSYAIYNMDGAHSGAQIVKQ